jgi:ubiquinone/menaquinone biosynthesis C-methylase UbiE
MFVASLSLTRQLIVTIKSWLSQTRSRLAESTCSPGVSDLTNSREHMRRDWDQRAQRDAFGYIASWRNDWDEASFFESGEQDYFRLVQPILDKLQIDPADMSMAELGCGVGRMTRSFARRFRSVRAVDISHEMQSRGKRFLQSFSNIEWILSDGASLSATENGSVDFVFSYLVLQHMTDKKVVQADVREMMRILKPSGAFLFQFNGSNLPTMNWKGRTVSAILDELSTMGFHGTSRYLANIAGIDPEMVGKTWRVAALSTEEIEKVVRSGHASACHFLDAGTPMAWCYGRRELGAP